MATPSYENKHFMSVGMDGRVAPLVPIRDPGLNKDEAIAFAAWMLVLARVSKEEICAAIDEVTANG